MACAAGACEVVRSGWTALRQRRVARYREPGRWLQRGSRKKTRWEGRLQPSDSKRAARSEGSRRPHRPGREAPDQPGSQTQRSPSRNAAQPPRRVLRVPLSHLDSGEGPDPRSQGQPVEEADSNRAKVTEPFPAGQNGGSPARRHPGAEPGYGPAVSMKASEDNSQEPTVTGLHSCRRTDRRQKGSVSRRLWFEAQFCLLQGVWFGA